LKQLLRVDTVEGLLKLTPEQKRESARDRCVAFQTGVIVEEDGTKLLMVPRTIEEAFTYENFALLRSGQLNVGTDVPMDLGEAYQAIFERIKSSSFKKTDFALDVLSSEQDWVTPGYIADGLDWLEDRLAEGQDTHPLMEN
jgi:hypothetical protein